MKYLIKYKFFQSNLVRKRNFFVNVLIISSLALVFSKNIEKIRYSNVKSLEGKIYILDRFTSTIKSVE